jgi:putative glutamine amidotransferase
MDFQVYQAMDSPIIGITTFHTSNPDNGLLYLSVTETYVKALASAGALPVLVPLGLPEKSLFAILNILDGLLFTGGGDIDPACYGETAHPLVDNVDPERDRVEIFLARSAAEKGIPFLGVCRGLQTINVARGGTLYRDILAERPGAMKHACFESAPRTHLAHPVEVIPGSLIAQILNGGEARVNSGHHQGIRKLGAGLRATAFAPDGLIEAFELDGHPFGLAVQWHPEWLTHLPEMAAIFKTFVTAVAENQAAKSSPLPA